MNIVILDGYALNPGDNPWTELNALGTVTLYDRTSPEDIVSRAAGAEIVITNKAPLTGAVIEALPALRMIGVTATGYNVVDTLTAARRGIPVCNVEAYGVNSVAQHVMALLLELCRRTSLHDASVRAGEWTNAPDWCYWKSPQIELTGKNMGVIGFGSIGQKVAELAHHFGMNLFVHTRTPQAPPAYAPFSFVDLNTLFAKADVISLHCPLTPSNQHLINVESLACMKSGVLLLNTARGQLLDEGAVAKALHSGHLGGFGADVLSQEPPQADNPLLHSPNTLITPHISWASLNARQNIIRQTVENIQAWQSGAPVRVVNL